MIFLSYILDDATPTYGNRNRFDVVKKSDISNGDAANDSFMSTTVHIGTHIDMPYHFYENGQTIEDYDANFWVFDKPFIVKIKPNNLIIRDELIEKLINIDDVGFDILIVKTGICNIRSKDQFWSENYGFHPDIYDYLIEHFPYVRVFGFDSISVSSFSDRLLGRETHKRFLNPNKPILLVEDMDLRAVDANTKLGKIIIAPTRISKCDGLPCTIMGCIDE